MPDGAWAPPGSVGAPGSPASARAPCTKGGVQWPAAAGASCCMYSAHLRRRPSPPGRPSGLPAARAGAARAAAAAHGLQRRPPDGRRAGGPQRHLRLGAGARLSVRMLSRLSVVQQCVYSRPWRRCSLVQSHNTATIQHPTAAPADTLAGRHAWIMAPHRVRTPCVSCIHSGGRRPADPVARGPARWRNAAQRRPRARAGAAAGRPALCGAGRVPHGGHGRGLRDAAGGPGRPR